MARKKKQQYPFHNLKARWERRQEELVDTLWENHGDVIVEMQQAPTHVLATAMAALLLFSSTVAHAVTTKAADTEAQPQVIHSQENLVAMLQGQLPPTVEPLDPVTEEEVGRTISEYFHVSAHASLYGNRLNRSYGLIGAEQHLMRYPGDTIASHFTTAEEANQFAASGMAPGRGAWGYFAPSDRAMTTEDVQREKYYIAVQTFLSPGWGERTNELYAFFKYRKMLVVNPENGKAMVVVIGDAGPGQSTGKHLGGSPEVMRYLERVDGSQKGPVLYYFLDDQSDQIPLGPIQIQ